MSGARWALWGLVAAIAGCSSAGSDSGGGTGGTGTGGSANGLAAPPARRARPQGARAAPIRGQVWERSASVRWFATSLKDRVRRVARAANHRSEPTIPVQARMPRARPVCRSVVTTRAIAQARSAARKNHRAPERPRTSAAVAKPPATRRSIESFARPTQTVMERAHACRAETRSWPASDRRRGCHARRRRRLT